MNHPTNSTNSPTLVRRPTKQSLFLLRYLHLTQRRRNKGDTSFFSRIKAITTSAHRIQKKKKKTDQSSLLLNNYTPVPLRDHVDQEPLTNVHESHSAPSTGTTGTTLARRSERNNRGRGGRRGKKGKKKGKEKKKRKEKSGQQQKSPPCHPFSHTAIIHHRETVFVLSSRYY